MTTPPVRPGLHVDREGRGIFAVAAPRAEAVDLCVRRGGTEYRQRLRFVDGGLHWDEVTSMVPGTQYGLRVSGPWDPTRGFVNNPNLVLLDPYARGVSHASPLLSSFFPGQVDAMLHPTSHPLAPSEVDNGPEAVWSVVTEPDFDWRGDRAPGHDWARSMIYELHVKGYTRRHPQVPAEHRGTYLGLTAPAVIEHLQQLGVTAIELLPIHAALDEAHLTRHGLTNFWGYSTLSYFAPNPAYATAQAQRAGAGAVLNEVKTMVRQLHAAGIEVILDVVYNHTAEGGADGPSVCWRGLDPRTYYWMHDAEYVDVTGCGNTVDPRSFTSVDMILESLRYWVNEVHIDGFRFDLAATLGRDDNGFRPDHPLLRAITTDPVLRGTKLIAEPWDIGTGGWQTGAFPPPFAEWNDAFRDDVRSFWLTDRAARARTGDKRIGGVRDIATRLSGSSDIFSAHDPQGLPRERSLRAPWAAVNYVTAHDGFTMRDLTMYEQRRNEANGENNADGTDNNRSFNHGYEGPVDAAELGEVLPHPQTARGIEAERYRTHRALLATLLLSAGTPMLLGGDEFARTQRGNNNAYCQDNDISWVHWDLDEHQRALLTVVQRLTQIRRDFPQLQGRRFLEPATPELLDAAHVAWFGADGALLTHDDWMDSSRHVLTMLRPADHGEWSAYPSNGANASAEPEHLYVIVNGEQSPVEVTLPAAPWPSSEPCIVFDSAAEDPSAPLAYVTAEGTIAAPAISVIAVSVPTTNR